MPAHVSLLLWFGVVLPAALVFCCAVGLAGYRFGLRFEIRHRHPGSIVRPVLPAQRRAGPHREYVDLTPAERAAFAGLVRQLSEGY
ncbi:hypothetical protein [Streptomyces thermodiastaticus]|jgi:hypothetical protein|uniref:hypothetical protein n=1 Tax=Streptomyces thermodiastaticus TaxID=44061 RepID=UPI0016732BCA|nr:hypothetical protein [Streptomyces thermodiastaticus]MCE7553353.1 hypothetical protein [Streptomyces thermodiastaticus]GHF96570.1 hypothetical protein GCM10018787_51480 [Streptomyces thermodiastaticus]